MRLLRYSFYLLSLSAVSGQNPNLQLTLADAEKTALQNNPQISAARLTAAASHQIPAQIHSNVEPTLFGSVTTVGADSGSRLAAGSLNNPVVYNRFGSGLSVSQLITDFGRNSNLEQSAKLRAQAQDFTTETSKAQVLLATDRAYFNLLRQQSLLKVAQQTVSARQLVVDQVSALTQAKMKSELDLSFAKVNLQEARLMLVGAQNDVHAAEADLATALGQPGQTTFTLTDEPTPDSPPDRIKPLLQEALHNRPELADLRLQENAAQHFALAERALMFPSVAVVATAGVVPAGQDVIPGRYGAVGVNLNIPIFNGGLFKARRSEAELRAKATAENVTDLANRVLRDVRVAYLNALTAYDRVGLTAQLLTQAQLALDLSQRRYDLGLSSIVELSQAQLNLTSAQIAGASAKYEYQIQYSVLRYQIGDLR